MRSAVELLENRLMLASGPTLWSHDRTGRLFTVNSGTGAVNIIGRMPEVMFDIAFDANGQLWGVDATSRLYKINKTNAAVTSVGAVGDFVNSLVFAPDGALLAAGDSLYRINTTTGDGTLLGSLGRAASGTQRRSSGDLAFDTR